jgi:hypothetical protein
MNLYKIVFLLPFLYGSFIHAEENYFDNVEKKEQFSKIWDTLTPKLEKLAVLEEESKNLPESTWFSRDKQSNQQEINEILDEAIDILSISNTTRIRQEIDLLEKEIQQGKEQITTYYQKQVSAPAQSKWKTTVDDYTNKIEEEKRFIEKCQQEIEQKKQNLLTGLNGLGLQISREQLDLLLASAVGNSITKNIIVYNNVRLVSQQLMELAKKSGEDLNISERYYGMYTILLKILLHMQNSFITDISQGYLPNIEGINSKTIKEMAEAKDLLKQGVDDN